MLRILFETQVMLPRIYHTPTGLVSIEQANIRDLGALRELENLCFPVDHWPLIDLIAVLTFPAVVRLKAVMDERMVGFIAGDRRGSKDMGWIATVAVHPDYRRKGIASILLSTCEELLNISRYRLTVRRSNLAAINLYRKLGYAEVGVWKKYYADGEDAIVFEKQRQVGL